MSNLDRIPNRNLEQMFHENNTSEADTAQESPLPPQSYELARAIIGLVMPKFSREPIFTVSADILAAMIAEKIDAHIASLRQQLEAANLAREQAEAELVRCKDALRNVFEILDDAPELNMSNYDEDEVAKLNVQMIAAYLLVRSFIEKGTTNV